MHAVNEGAGPEHSFGVNIRLPFEQKSNPVLEGNPRNIMYKYFFNRKDKIITAVNVVPPPGAFCWTALWATSVPSCKISWIEVWGDSGIIPKKGV